MRKKVFLVAIIFIFTFLMAGCDGGKAKASKTEGSAKESAENFSDATEATEPTTTEAAAPEPAEASKDAVSAPRNAIATIVTNKGTIKFEFFPDDAPNHVNNFITLAERGFYDGTKWHRVVESFVIQGGDPNSKDDDPSNDGAGGPGYSVDAEFNSKPHLEGTVAMARAQDPNSAGSQFYICLGPQPSLDGQYTVFGQVTDGLDVVHEIAQGDTIEKVTIQK